MQKLLNQLVPNIVEGIKGSSLARNLLHIGGNPNHLPGFLIFFSLKSGAYFLTVASVRGLHST